VNTQNGLVQRLWSYCNVLRDDGLSYGDYLEQLTYLLFLKMADEQTKPPFSRPAIVPEGLDWASLLARDGDELEVHYRHVLTELGRKPGMLGVVFRKAQNRIQGPGQAAPAGRRPDRPRELADARRRRQGRCLRGPAGEER
jgi:type I restriction enzyme M protein